MFTGIIESLGTVVDIKEEGSNKHFAIKSAISADTYIDQSISHNGICLTVVKIEGDIHTVTAVAETLRVSCLGNTKKGDLINLERSMTASTRLDGHFVQGHVDTFTTCTNIAEEKGSWYFTFHLPETYRKLVVSKGSICVNGVSLTVVEPTQDQFKVAIIPYTYEHTNFHRLKIGDVVNLEFDILGKYVTQYLSLYNGN